MADAFLHLPHAFGLCGNFVNDNFPITLRPCHWLSRIQQYTVVSVGGVAMTQSEYEAELHFRLCKSIFATLAIRGIIGEDDLRILLCAAAEKYHAPIGELEVNSIAGEKNYTGWVPGQDILPGTAAAHKTDCSLCQSIHHEGCPGEQSPSPAGVFHGIHPTPSGLGLCRDVLRKVNPRIDTKKCCCQSGRMAWNQGLSEIRNSPATHSLRPIVADIMTTAQMILTTATEKMTTPQAMVTTAERNVTTSADNSKISYKHETFYILFKFANSVKAPKAQIRKKRGKAKHYLKSPRVTYWQHRRHVL